MLDSLGQREPDAGVVELFDQRTTASSSFDNFKLDDLRRRGERDDDDDDYY